MKIKKICVLIILAIVIILLSGESVQARLQSNGEEPAIKILDSWIIEIRKMQEIGGTLGLKDIINANLTSNNTNIDIHLQKNTEYGALVILSASGYGNPDKIQDGGTTTGNNSGVVMRINGERVSVAIDGSRSSNFNNALARYKNVYGNTYVRQKGDGMDIGSWHGSTVTSYLGQYQGHPDSGSALLRACGGSIFSYNGYSHYSNGGPATDSSTCARAALVVGAGI